MIRRRRPRLPRIPGISSRVFQRPLAPFAPGCFPLGREIDDRAGAGGIFAPAGGIFAEPAEQGQVDSLAADVRARGSAHQRFQEYVGGQLGDLQDAKSRGLIGALAHRLRRSVVGVVDAIADSWDRFRDDAPDYMTVAQPVSMRDYDGLDDVLDDEDALPNGMSHDDLVDELAALERDGDLPDPFGAPSVFGAPPVNLMGERHSPGCPNAPRPQIPFQRLMPSWVRDAWDAGVDAYDLGRRLGRVLHLELLKGEGPGFDLGVGVKQEIIHDFRFVDPSFPGDGRPWVRILPEGPSVLHVTPIGRAGWSALVDFFESRVTPAGGTVHVSPRVIDDMAANLEALTLVGDEASRALAASHMRAADRPMLICIRESKRRVVTDKPAGFWSMTKPWPVVTPERWPSFIAHPDDPTRCYVCGNVEGAHGTAFDHCPPFDLTGAAPATDGGYVASSVTGAPGEAPTYVVESVRVDGEEPPSDAELDALEDAQPGVGPVTDVVGDPPSDAELDALEDAEPTT